MSDKIKVFLSILFFAAAIITPLFGIATTIAALFGWIDASPWTGVGIAVVPFLVFFTIGGGLLAWVEDLSWLGVSLPFLAGTMYTLVDLVPIPIDDAAATTVGAIFTFLLALRKEPNTPKWVFLPLIAAGAYALLGGTIPGPVDELVVDIVALLIAGYGVSRADGAGEE